MKCYRLYVCVRTGHDNHDSDHDEDVAAVVAARFESFTMTHGTEWFRGRREPVRIVMIATNDEAAVIEMSDDQRR